MRKYLIHTIFYCVMALCLSCVKEPENMEPGLEPSLQDGEPVDLVLDFGAPNGTIFVMDTKSDMGMEAESKIWNFYIFLFDCDGNKFYGHYFDVASLDNETLSDYWTVHNFSKDIENDKTYGTVHLHTVYKSDDEGTPSKDESKITIVGITNIDSSILNVSPEQLGNVNTYSSLYNLAATLNQPIVERTGYFPMSGQLENVQMRSSGGVMKVGDNNAKLILQRMDAKVVFKIKVADGTQSEIKSFTPDRWEVYNLPNKSYILEHGAYSASRDSYLASGRYNSSVHAGISDYASSPSEDFFNTDPANYHSETIPDAENTYHGTINPIIQHEFTFYMMENRRAPQYSSPDLSLPATWTYQNRDERKKTVTSSGTSSTATNGAFRYAPPLGTYVKFGGFIEMAIPSDLPSGGSFTLSANVEYIVHLGNFSNDHYADFDIFRNHTYIYNITIYDAESIRVEVEENFDPWPENNLDEAEPGATGLVTVSKEEIFDCDAHYNSHVITFHLDNLLGKDEFGNDKVEDLTWYVKTPFNPEGEQPEKKTVNGVEIEIYDGLLDYQWVEFRINDMDGDEYLKNKRQIYKPHIRTGYPNADEETMDIADLVVFLKREAQKAIDGSADCKFDNKNGPGRRKICVTAYINEYYYETNPITGSFETDLWKRVVNQPMRYMHILAGSQKAADGESRGITASFTIRQKSIQSIYAIDHDNLYSAWGSEHFDDDIETGTVGAQKVYSDGKNQVNRGNNSLTNGRENTLKEWGLLNANGTIKTSGDKKLLDCETQDADNPLTPAEAKWSNYMDLTADNITPLMKSKYQYLRYSCMSRNRDNNGNGVIDKDEVRWYMGATNQLYGLFLGSYGIDGDAKLYQRGISEQDSNVNDVWRQHVISSTRYSGNSDTGARVIWAEEGVTGSTPAMSDSWSGINTYSTRCVRNLGVYNNQDITKADISVEPDNYIHVKRMKDGEEFPSSSVIESSYPTYNYGSGPYAWSSDVYYEFDCTRMNKASLRYYWPKELDFTDEFDQAACLPPKFRVASKGSNPNIDKADLPGLTINNFEGINTYLNGNIGDNPFCPPGYRLPNVRELVLLRYFLPETVSIMDNSFIGSGVNIISRTYWSFGSLGRHDKTGLPYKPGSPQPSYTGWATTSQKIIMSITGQHTTTSVRCVQDIDPSLP